MQEGFEDTKSVMRIRKSKDRQHNDQTKKEQKDIKQTLHRKLKIEQHEPTKRHELIQVLRKGKQFLLY